MDEEWLKKMIKAYSGILLSLKGKKSILSFATIWMNLEDMVPTEISQTQKDN